MVALPAVTAVTRPLAETELTAELLELQVTERPLSTLLPASRITAESCTVPPTCRLAVPGETETDATGTGGGALMLRLEEALLPSLEAEIVAVPAATAVTTPVAATAAILGFELCQL